MRTMAGTCSMSQIKALLKKDALIRLRQPWMTIVQFLWPCIIFISLYALRNRFQPKLIDDCQFPTRQLPTKNNLLPFFHSHICTIENACENIKPYQEYTSFENAPIKPLLNIVQTFLNEEQLYKALTELPEKMNFVSAVTTLATHSKFKYIENNIHKIVEWVPKVQEMLGDNFDIKMLFANDRMFSNSGKVICGRPFPRDDNIRFVRNILYTEDFSDVNNDELNAMPTKYCKQLYLDISSSNNGKMTWSIIKPVIQGKIIYGPYNNESSSIIKLANTTFEEFHKFQKLAESLKDVIVKLRTDDKFKESFMKLIELARSPFVQVALGGSVDVKQIESIMNMLMTDQTIVDVVQTVHNLLECFNVDRFIAVDNEKQLEEKAYELSKKRLFFAGLYFNETINKDIVYKFRMEPDNVPVTIETRNRFWFPGPEASMTEHLRYHRGFIQIKHSVDLAIIKHVKKKNKIEIVEDIDMNKKNNAGGSGGDDDDWFWNDDDDNENTDKNKKEEESSTKPITLSTLSPIGPSIILQNLNDSLKLFNKTELSSLVEVSSTQLPPIIINEKDTPKRKKRQLDGLLGLLLGGGNSKKPPEDKFDVDDVIVYTKQFPYPRYIKDDFKTGLYLAQSIQVAFFMALIVQIATCVRYRIWMKESKNTMVMRSMGLKVGSEIFAWEITTFIEIIIIFVIACIVLYSGGIMQHTGLVFVFIYLIIFGLCTISFCYMCSNIFSSASMGSVASSILFLMTFMPYIVIICLDAKLSEFLKFITNLSLSTAFCYAWDHIMRLELQEKGLTFTDVIHGGLESEFTYALLMTILDTIVYAIIGYLVDYFKNDEFKFHSVAREDLDINLGASIENASVIYPENKIAVSNISAAFPRHKVTCLLGRNGAGKSTIIKMLTGQVKPTSGKIALSQALSDSTVEQIGFCSQDNVLIPQLTAKEHLEMYARIKLKENFDFEVAKTMKGLKMGKYENYEAHKLSGGYQRRLCVAIAFIGSPNLVILDEPCSGVDTKARKCVWELIESLRKGRAVVLATHHLDEAEYLSDSVLILHEGSIIAKHNSNSLKDLFTKSYEIFIKSKYNENSTIEEIKLNLNNYLDTYDIIHSTEEELKICVPYKHEINKDQELFEYLENLQKENKIDDISICSKNLEEIFNNLSNNDTHINGYSSQKYEKIDLNALDDEVEIEISTWDMIKTLLWKRSLHFRRNYRLILCILILPIIFEVIAMSFMQLRPVGQYDPMLNLTKALYSDTTEFLSIEDSTSFINDTYKGLDSDCHHCEHFNNSKEAFNWILNTHDSYHMKRYGGLTFNNSNGFVWYNNKGYHSMPSWLSDLNSHMMKIELQDSAYQITTVNHPLKVGEKELSTSSILQQVADAGVSLIILIAFSLVIAGSSVYLVNERVTGEKLQQKLCGVKFHTYWGVAFLWDFIIYLIALVLCVIVFKFYNIPVYVDKYNLNGICLLLVLFGFACIPAVHVMEKLFAEASFANMAVFCLSVTIPLTTLTIIILFDILGETDESEKWRNFLNRAFLIFPQHALADGLIEICKNYIVSQVFIRYDIDSYKSPVSSNLLRPHFLSLFILGVIFIIMNYIIENRIISKVVKRIFKKDDFTYELRIVSIQNSLTRSDKYSTYSNAYAIKVDNLYKSYKRNDYAVKNVSFHVRTGECFGLLGKNGAGKSTIFKILSGQMQQDSGNVDFYNKEIGYCPQTSAMDPLLTVKEVIEFYGKLRRISETSPLIWKTLKSFHLSAYKNVLVKNLSGGNRRKLNVAVSCFGNSSVVLMDEPTSDMDPITRALVYKTIKNLISEQRAVLLTSHTVSEIDQICQRIAVLKHGKIISTGSPEELKEQYGSFYMVTVFPNKSNTMVSKKEIRETFPGCIDIQTHPNVVKFVVKIQSRFNEVKAADSKTKESLTLTNLITKIKNFSTEHSVQYTLAKCRLDMIFEKILDFKDADGGYIHKGFDQTETVT